MPTGARPALELVRQAPSPAGQEDSRHDDLAYPTIPAPTQPTSKRPYISYLVFTLCASLYFLPFMRLLLQGTDEGTLIGQAIRIVHGQVFARDFFELIAPGTFYWLALFFKLFGVTFLATRLCLFLTSLGTAFLMYFLSRRVCRRYQSLPCVLLFATCFGALWPEISPHTDSNFLALLACAGIALWQDSRRSSLLLAAGFLAGATTWFLLPKGVLLLGAFVVWLWAQRLRRSASLSSLGLVAAGYVSAIGCELLYFWSQGALHDLIYESVLWPFRHYSAVGNVHYALGIFQYYWDRWIIPTNGIHWMLPLAAVLIIPFLFVAALPVLVLILSVRHRIDIERPQILLYWLCGWALWLSEIHRKDIFHLVYGSPLLMILFIYFLAEYRGKIANVVLQILTVSAAALATFNLLLVLTAHPVATRVGTVAMFKDNPVLTFLDSHVAPGTEILAYPYCPIYYFLSDTVNPTRYAAFTYGFTPPSVYLEVIRNLDQHDVRYVVWDTNFEAKIANSVFPAAKRMRPHTLILEPYLESHYRVIKDFNGVRIMERKADNDGGQR